MFFVYHYKMGPLTAEIMKQALNHLDERLDQSVHLLIGGGGAMVLAHGFPIGTTDIDAISKGIDIAELDRLVKQIANDHQLPHDWLNPYFSTFTHVLPSDYGARLKTVFTGKHLKAEALGATDLLVMKCFAHRQKDVGHAKTLISKNSADIQFVKNQFELLRKKKIPGVDVAEEFLEDILDQIE